ncbi:hypothetical protein Glove_71g60 [Diversispora epigaea]|uniref:Uncharacterized protein n=1 Tax=Diversispora epigaea TaxID=1348612 RepID=A0A397J9Y3_9GLOM|nr:hypothetical protein Glove_71g60 [Diversispora epigaea]
MNIILHLLNSLSSDEGNDANDVKGTMKVVNDDDGLSRLAILYAKLEDNEFRVKMCIIYHRIYRSKYGG